ncbi:acyl carrier protein [Conexibacter woesei]|jgi:acyl carrier protein|uniref:acyl carrier protein n=1 Tax=Conexibacter woesei TaxID=191495 RepID=UPI00040DF461
MTDVSFPEVREIVKEHGRLAADVETLADGDSLYEAGMTSHASVNVMLALEDAFDVEFPDEMLKRSVFESVASIAAALQQLDAPLVA